MCTPVRCVCTGHLHLHITRRYTRSHTKPQLFFILFVRTRLWTLFTRTFHFLEKNHVRRCTEPLARVPSCHRNGCKYKCFEVQYCHRKKIHFIHQFFSWTRKKTWLQSTSTTIKTNNHQQRSLLCLFGRFTGGCCYIFTHDMLRESNS